MKKREEFSIFKRNWLALRHLSADQLGRLLQAFVLYEPGAEQEIDDDIAVAYDFIRLQLNADSKVYDVDEAQDEQPKSRRGNPNFKKGQPNPYQLKKVDEPSNHYNSPIIAIIQPENNENYSRNYENKKENKNNILNNINNNLINYNINSREKTKREKVNREKAKREPPVLPVLPEQEQPSNKKPNDNRQMKKTRKNNQQLDLSAVAPEYREIVDEWLAYKRERHQAYRQIGFNLCYKHLLTMSCQSPDKARQIVEQSIANNWAGLFQLKNQNNYGLHESYDERRKRESEQRELEFKQAVERIMRTGYDDEPDRAIVW